MLSASRRLSIGAIEECAGWNGCDDIAKVLLAGGIVANFLCTVEVDHFRSKWLLYSTTVRRGFREVVRSLNFDWVPAKR